MIRRRRSWLRRAASLAWELPQTVLGAAAFVSFLARGKIVRARWESERVFVRIRAHGAVSLGWFVFFTPDDNPWVPVGPENRDHEYGHALQSRMLGPLYLPVVGVPSTMRVLYAYLHEARHGTRWGGYYDGFPESWADRLGRVDRRMRPRP